MSWIGKCRSTPASCVPTSTPPAPAPPEHHEGMMFPLSASRAGHLVRTSLNNGPMWERATADLSVLSPDLVEYLVAVGVERVPGRPEGVQRGTQWIRCGGLEDRR